MFKVSTTDDTDHAKLRRAINRVFDYTPNTSRECRVFIEEPGGTLVELLNGEDGEPITLGDLIEVCSEIND